MRKVGDWLVLVVFADGEAERLTVSGETMADALNEVSVKLDAGKRETPVLAVRVDPLNEPYFI
jgi:hypothetical protein